MDMCLLCRKVHDAKNSSNTATSKQLALGLTVRGIQEWYGHKYWPVGPGQRSRCPRCPALLKWKDDHSSRKRLARAFFFLHRDVVDPSLKSFNSRLLVRVARLPVKRLDHLETSRGNFSKFVIKRW